MEQMQLEERLRAEIADNPENLMVIVGAGISRGAVVGTECYTRAHWVGLIRHGLQHAIDHELVDRVEAETIEGWLRHDNPSMWISVAEQLTRLLGGPGGGEFKVWLREALGSFAESIRDRSVLDSIVALQRRGAIIATVNYDGVLEQATGSKPVTWLDSSEVERVLRKESEGILHLHGHWEKPDSVVLGRSSYTKVIENEHAVTMLRSVCALRTMVFVGTGAGMHDPNWRGFQDWAAQVFSEGQTYHYRIVLESEKEKRDEPGPRKSRIFPVPYRGGYAGLGPFLRGLLPSDDRASVPSVPTNADLPSPEPPGEHVLMLLNIGNKTYTTISAEEVQKFAGLPEPVKVLSVERTLDLREARARHWREIAEQLDELCAQASQAAKDASGPLTFVIAGRAPLPVFAYLGYRTKLLNGRVLIVNQQGARWDTIGPFSTPEEFPPGLRDVFVPAPALRVQRDAGMLGLFVGSSNKYICSDDALDPVARAEGQDLSWLLRIEGKLDHDTHPLNQDDLATLATVLGQTQADIARKISVGQGLVMAIGGPAWLAYWLGRLVNTNVVDLVHFPNFVPGKGYVRALASRMNELRWTCGPPRILVLAAEASEKARIRAGEAQDALLDAIEREQGSLARRQVETVGAAKNSDLVRRLGNAQPDILHINMHGGEDGSLAFQDDQNHQVVVSEEDFLAALRSTGVLPSLIVVGACYSVTLVPALLEVAEIVVGVEGEARYTTSAKFIGALYGSLARGNSVEAAFEQAKAHVDLQPRHNSEPYRLLFRDGIDPRDAVFWPPRE